MNLATCRFGAVKTNVIPPHRTRFAGETTTSDADQPRYIQIGNAIAKCTDETEKGELISDAAEHDDWSVRRVAAQSFNSLISRHRRYAVLKKLLDRDDNDQHPELAHAIEIGLQQELKQNS